MRAGLCLARYNEQEAWLRAKSTAESETLLNVSRKAARALLRTTIKKERIEAGRAKRAERDAKLSSKRARREAKAAELQRIRRRSSRRQNTRTWSRWATATCPTS